MLTAAGLVFAGLVFTGPAAAEVKLALDTPADLEQSGTYVWAHAFAEHLRANGMEVVEYQRGALGEEQDRLDQLSQGLIEVSLSDVRAAGSLDTLVFGVYLPFLFESTAHLYRALDEGGLLERINARVTSYGVRVLGVPQVGLMSGIFNTKQPIARLEDMAELRMRALDESQIELFEAWGATGTVISFSEVPSALQTGVADGYINPPFVPLLFGHQGFIKHFTYAKQSPSSRLALASEDWYQGLSEAERAVVDAAAAKGNAATLAWLETRGGKLDELEAAGIEVTELTEAERARFVEASRAVYESGVLSPAEVELWVEAAGD
ncbi:C4-dicarboxylate ABC transporter substrate-binding protein [Phormidium willei BDU 130791]|nr:C4-dicarboxylate ABC transporter substrate-binding protein [Phormidium willei BDU 130791]